MEQELFKFCRFVVSDKLPDQNEKLREYIADKLNFRIARYKPFTIEKENVTYQDLQALIETLKAKYEPEENDYVFVSDSERHCNQTQTSTNLRTDKDVVGTKISTPEIMHGKPCKQNENTCAGEDISQNTTDVDDEIENISSKFGDLMVSPQFNTSRNNVEKPKSITEGPVKSSCESHELASVETTGVNTALSGRQTTSSANEASVNEIIATEERMHQNATDGEEKNPTTSIPVLVNYPPGNEAREDVSAVTNKTEIDSRDVSSSRLIGGNGAGIECSKSEKSKLCGVEFGNKSSNKEQVSMISSVNMSLPSQNLADSYAEIESNITQSKPEQVFPTSNYHKGTDISITASQIDYRKENDSFVSKKMETDQDASEKINEEKINKEDTVNPHHVSERNRLSISGNDDKKQNEEEFSRGQDDENSENETCFSEKEKVPLYFNKQFNMKEQLGENIEAVKGTEHHQHREHNEDTEDGGNESAHLNERQRQMIKDTKSYQRQEMPKNDQKQTVKSTTDKTMKYMTDDRDVSARVPQGSNDDSIKEYTLNWSEGWNFKFAERYMSTESYKPYFENATTKDTQVTFRINKSDPDAKAFLKQVKQLKFEKIGFNIRDKEKAMKLLNKVEGDTGTTMSISHNFFLIVGMKEEVSRAKKLITEKLQNLDRTEYDSSQLKYNQDKGYMRGSSQTFRSEGGNTRGSEYDTIPSMTIEPHSAHSIAVNAPITTPFRDNDTFSPTQRYPLQSSYHKPQCFTTEKCKLVVQIHQADITTLKADVIVNAANRRLQHAGGVAKAISKAAGWELNKECEDYIKSGKIVNVTDIFKSKGGNLPAKFVFHAVGPKWDAYDDKQKCIDDLRCTVLRCLVEAGRQGVTSIAFPSISAAIFKVPKEHCARCYMEAVKHFDEFNAKEGSALEKVHFIDVDDTMINHITECFTKNWDKRCDLEKLPNDFKFAYAHLSSTLKTQAASNEKSYFQQNTNSKNTRPPSSLAGSKETASALGTVEKSASFQFGRVTLHLKSKHAFDYRSGITVTIGKPFDELSGLPGFKIKKNLDKADNLPIMKKKFEFFHVTKPGGKQPRLLVAVYPEPDTLVEITDSFYNAEMAIHNCDMKEISRGLIITSSILYGGKQKGGKTNPDPKKIGRFGDLLHQYVIKLEKDAQFDVTITAVASEDSLPTIQRVIESRKKQTDAPGAYPRNKWDQGMVGSKDDKRDLNRESERHQQPRQIWNSEHGTSQRDEHNKFRDGDRFGGTGGFSHSSTGSDENYNTRTANPKHSGQQHLQPRQGEGSGYHHNKQRDEWSKSKEEGRFGEEARSASCGQTDQSYHNITDSSTSVDPQKSCQICFDDRKSFHPTHCCGVLVCSECEIKVPACPFCRHFWRVIKGIQPDGSMKVELVSESAEGYEHCPAWKIEYSFFQGRQQGHHPNPGKYYSSCKRVAYLPANEESFDILTLLRLSFIRRLTFTIGSSLTTSRDDTITWNDIHHKTSLHGGTYGYPDQTYMSRVASELADKGVRFDTTTDEEKRDLEDFRNCLWSSKYFYKYQ